MKRKSGFTLPEILVVIAIIALIGTVLVAIFTNTLRGSNKSQVLAVIKQNGQAILENMEKTIRTADNVICISTSVPNSIVTVKNGIYTRYRIVYSSDLPNTVAPLSCLGSGNNGCIIADYPTLGFSETITGFLNRVCSSSDPMNSGVDILSDTNPRSGVSIANRLIILDKPAGFKAQVSIKFDLRPGVGAPQAVSSQIDPVTFETTVQLR